ncbi:MAG TPA: DUF302 domain-containing protein [Acidimicrobiales bacterium]|nr:DUF302 domain-containing protein [Acidimicrobiales bacterium]
MDGIELTVDQPADDAERAVRQALQGAGFGVLTEIDVAATLEAKLGVIRPPLKILGACNPTFAHRALSLDPSLALVLPCNVVLEDAGGVRTRVTIADPRSLFAAGQGASGEVHALVDEAAEALEGVAATLRG